jgi:hypothetical protein
MSKIKPHVFHEFFSRYDRDLELTKRWNRNPSHSIRSFFGAKDPYTQDPNIKITEFATEEEALIWYKKTQMSQVEFDKIKSEPLCKNYFVIPEADFSRYRGAFNQMIKSIKIQSEFEVDGDGNFLVSCPASDSTIRPVESEEVGTAISDTITVNNPYGSSYYQGTLTADDIGYLDGRQVTQEAGYYDIKLSKNKKSSLSAYFKDTIGGNVGGALNITWYKEDEYKTKLSITNNFDSSKIFEIKELEDRVSANNFSYSTYKVYTATNIDDASVDNEGLKIRNRDIFEKNWSFNKENFRQLFINQKFNFDSTFKNDPIFLPYNATYFIDKYINLNFNNYYDYYNDGCDKNSETNFTKTYNKLGEYKINIQNTNAYFDQINQVNSFSLSNIIYIRSKKIYLCFIDFNHSITCKSTTVSYNTECGIDCIDPSLSSANINSFLHTVSTNDSIKSSYKDFYYQTICDKPLQKFEFEVKTLDLKILDKTFKVEYQSLKQEEFKIDYRQCNADCPPDEPLDPPPPPDGSGEIPVFTPVDLLPLDEPQSEEPNYCNNPVQFLYSKMKIKTTKNYLIEIVPWIKEDFDKNLVFPPKIQ